MAQPDLIGIVVHDMAASLQFYRLLGLDIPTCSSIMHRKNGLFAMDDFRRVM